MSKRNLPKLFEIIVLILPVLSLAGLGLLVRGSSYRIQTLADAFGFIKAATLFRRPHLVVLLTFQGVLAVVVALVLLLQVMLDKVPLPFEKPDQSPR